MKSRNVLRAGLFATLVTVGLALAPRPAASTLRVLSQMDSIAVTIYVGVTPSPTASPTGATGSETVNVSVGATTPQYMQPSTKDLIFVGNAGQTVSQPCAIQIWLSPNQGASDIEVAMSAASFANISGGSTSLSLSAFQIQPSPYAAVGWATYTSPPGYAEDGDVAVDFAAPPVSGQPSPICVGAKVNIPTGTASGVYYDVLSIPYLAPYPDGGSPAVPPTASPSPTPTPTPIPTPSGYIYTLFGDQIDGNTPTMAAFNANATGNAAPSFTITADITNPADAIADSSGNIYISDRQESGSQGHVWVFSAGTSPSLIGTLPLGGTEVSVDPDAIALDASDDIYITDPYNGVQEFANGSWLTGGNTTPIATLSDGSTTEMSDAQGIAVSPKGEMFIANYSTSPNSNPAPPGSILIFAPGSGSSGNVAPTLILGSSADDIGNPQGVQLDAQGNIYVVTSDDGANPRIMVFAAGSSGNAAPIAEISGSNTGISEWSPSYGFGVTPAGGIFVSTFSPEAVLYFQPGSNGNVAPLYSISGSNTGFLSGEALSVGL